MARRLVVEREAASVVPDPGQPRGKGQPARGGDGVPSSNSSLPVDGMERVGGPGVLEVGEDQLLVLLFVMDAQQDRRRDLPQGLSIRRPEELGHVLVHVGTVAEHFHRPSGGTAAPAAAAASAAPRPGNRS